MSDHEPYVADPREPRPRPRLFAAQPLLVLAIVVLVAGAITFLVLHDLAEQDPSLEAPEAAPTEEPSRPES